MTHPKVEKKVPQSVLDKEKLKNYIALYDVNDLKYFYFNTHNGIRVTALSVLNRDTLDVKVAFSFCSRKDHFNKVKGKLLSFSRLEDPEHKYTVSIPWVGNSMLTVVAAWHRLKDLPLKLAGFRMMFDINEIRIIDPRFIHDEFEIDYEDDDLSNDPDLK